MNCAAEIIQVHVKRLSLFEYYENYYIDQIWIYLSSSLANYFTPNLLLASL